MDNVPAPAPAGRAAMIYIRQSNGRGDLCANYIANEAVRAFLHATPTTGNRTSWP